MNKKKVKKAVKRKKVVKKKEKSKTLEVTKGNDQEVTEAKQRFKHPGGRPTKLNKSKLKETVKYFEEYQQFYECPVTITTKKGTTVEKMERQPNPPPTFMELAEKLGVTRWTIWYWIKHVPEFSHIVEQYRHLIVKEMIQVNALMNKYNPQFSKAYMENEFGWGNSQDTETGKTTPKQQFTTQINYFLSQQGVAPIPDKAPELTPFKDD